MSDSILGGVIHALSYMVPGANIGAGGSIHIPGTDPQQPTVDVILKPIKDVAHFFGAGKAPNVVQGSRDGNKNGEPREVTIYSHPVMGKLGDIIEGVIGAGSGVVFPLHGLVENIQKLVHPGDNPPDPKRHWAVLVGNVFHELNGDINLSGGNVQLDVLYQNGLADASDYKWEKYVVGWTKFDDQAIMREGEDVIKHMPAAYNIYDNNCQKFVIELLSRICEPGRRQVVTSYSYITGTKLGIEIPFLSSHTETPVKQEETELYAKEEGLKLAEAIMNEHTPRISVDDIGTFGLKEDGKEIVVVHPAETEPVPKPIL